MWNSIGGGAGFIVGHPDAIQLEATPGCFVNNQTKTIMDIIVNWNQIRAHFSRSFGSSLHVAIASVDANHQPTNTPIGTLFLNKDQSGFYFEKFPRKLPQHAEGSGNICILGVNSSRWFWIKSLFKERFSSYPAVKLYAELGQRRKATDREIRALSRRMRFTSRLRGHQYLWANMAFVREIKVNRAEMIQLGKMTEQL